MRDPACNGSLASISTMNQTHGLYVGPRVYPGPASAGSFMVHCIPYKGIPIEGSSQLK